MTWPHDVRRFLLTTALGRMLLIGPRLGLALWRSRALHAVAFALRWAFASRDIAPRTYATTALNQDDLCWTVALVSGRDFDQIARFRDEVIDAPDLAAHMAGAVAASPERWSHDATYLPGRRLAFYLLVRAMRPARVIELGVDRGLGAMLVCRALTRNRAEGAPGEYIGLDRKGADDAFLYNDCPDRIGRIEQGDAVAGLRRQTGAGSLIIHDTGVETAHMAEIVAALDRIVAEDTVIVSSWVHPLLLDFARRRGRAFLSHKDSPIRHWKSGSRLSFIFPRR